MFSTRNPPFGSNVVPRPNNIWVPIGATFPLALTVDRLQLTLPLRLATRRPLTLLMSGTSDRLVVKLVKLSARVGANAPSCAAVSRTALIVMLTVVLAWLVLPILLIPVTLNVVVRLVLLESAWKVRLTSIDLLAPNPCALKTLPSDTTPVPLARLPGLDVV